MKRACRRLPATLALLAAFAATSSADDWPTYRADASRSGYTKEALPLQLVLRWTFRGAAPQPAWPTHDRMTFDLAAQPILMGDTVVFGSSSDDRVVALHSRTGAVRWTFHTEGPVRLAPAGWKDRVFVAGDDGRLYALALSDGRLLWSFRPGPDGRRALGNDRIVSRWPVRGGPVVFQDTLYVAAGVWPSEGVYVHALDPESGRVLWMNDSTGTMVMDQPHKGAQAASGVTPQGHLLADADRLYLPTGRAVPAAFRRADGVFEYYRLQENSQRGGSEALLADRFLVNAGCFFNLASGRLEGRVGPGSTAAVPGGLVRAEGRAVLAYNWIDVDRVDAKGGRTPARMVELVRQAHGQREIRALIVAAGNVVLGEEGRVSAIDYRAQRNTWWSHEIEGTAHGLAYANGVLVVSTDAGAVYGFDGGGYAPPAGPRAAAPAVEESDAGAAQAAAEILERSGVSEGYCVDLGAGTGDLAIELARRSRLTVVAVEADPAKVDRARARLQAAGLNGLRVTVLRADPADPILPGRFANLVVSSRTLRGEPEEALRKEMERLQRPHGGVICAGRPGAQKAERLGAPKGEGSWTHQNADPANTLCSDDQISGPLSMHWYRDVDFELPNRHGQAPTPLYDRGVMVAGGVDGLCALDAYNGRTLWIHEMKGLLKDFDGIHHDVGVGDAGSPFCLDGGSAYARQGERCVRLDLQTGKVLGEFRTPVPEGMQDRAWGYLAARDGRLYGSISDEAHTVSPLYRKSSLRTESVLLFALDPANGEVLWRYRPEHSIRNNAIAVSGDRVYLIDRPQGPTDRLAEPTPDGRTKPLLKPGEHAGGTLVALDARTGKVLWKQSEDVFGTQLAVSERSGVVLMSFQAVRHRFFKLPSEIGGRIAAFNAADGVRLWDKKADYQTRPVLQGDALYAQGGAWDLRSGSEREFKFKRSYGCGQISSGANLMLFRSGTLGYLDRTREAGTENWGGVRPSCWISAIPAGGLVLSPDGSAKCLCSYQMKAWFALQGAK